ncbi:hypothetical protein CBR_g45626 [Chara braunii]|uniref:Mutator-like transposase domain-containing protein n=1 Tax=Chara braunii TaxID=69332 RepID=A0A388LZ15_CHABU|nr:hypothetical protein CBR_g45626 [Chara braunii]|eukprot:GBG87568.1 hypothetical protein CBR_g45626 [Chara braunii]
MDCSRGTAVRAGGRLDVWSSTVQGFVLFELADVWMSGVQAASARRLEFKLVQRADNGAANMEQRTAEHRKRKRKDGHNAAAAWKTESLRFIRFKIVLSALHRPARTKRTAQERAAHLSWMTHLPVARLVTAGQQNGHPLGPRVAMPRRCHRMPDSAFFLGVSPYGSPDDMRSTKRPCVHSLSPTVVVTPGVAVVHSPLPPLLPSSARRPYTPVHPLSDFDAMCFPVLSPPLQPRRLQFLSCAAQPFPPLLFVGRDGLDSIPLEGCSQESQSSAAVFGSGGSTLRDEGRRSPEPRVSHSFAASGHGQGGVLDDARRASAGDTHDRNSARRSLVSRFNEDDIVCGSGDGPGRCDLDAQNLGAGPSKYSGGSLGQFGSQSIGSAKYSHLFLTTACKERLRLLQSAMKEVSDKSGVMSDVVDRLLHWSLPAIQSEFGDGERMIRQRTLRTADAEDDGEREGEGSGGGNGGSFCGSDDSLPRSGHGSQRGRRSRGQSPSRGRSRSHFKHVRPLCWDDSKDGALQSGPCNNRFAHVLESMGHWEGSKAPDVVFVEPVKLLQLLGLFDLSCPRHGAGCVVDVSSVGYPGQICRISFACKKSCHWTWHNALVVGVVYSCRLQQQLFHATVTAGMTYTVLNDFCIALGVAPVHKPTFYSCMRGEPNVHEGWNAKVVRQGVRYSDLAIDTVMRSGRPVTFMVDGRYDSARSAHHCTVTAIECDTRLVVGVHTLRPKKEGKASNQLEVPAVVRLLRGLLSRGLKIRCVVSDDCAALGPQLERLGIKWQKDCHHKVKNIRKALRKVVKLKVPKKLNNRHQCVSKSQFMQFTKKELLDALTDRFGPGDEGGDFVTLHNDVMMIADHWAGDHSRCVADRELLCSKAGGPSRLPLYTHNDPVYDIIRHTLGRHCSTTVCSYYTKFRHTSTVETFQGTIIIYAKKALHFEKSYEPRLAIAVIRWNSHAWQDPLEYRVRRSSGTSIRPRPSHYRHNRPPTDSWMDRLSTFIFGSKCVSDWVRRLLEYDDCDVSSEVGSSTPPLPRDLFCKGEDTIARDEDDVASGADLDVVGDDDVFIIGDGDGLPVPTNVVPDRSCDSLSDGDDAELFDD